MIGGGTGRCPLYVGEDFAALEGYDPWREVAHRSRAAGV